MCEKLFFGARQYFYGALQIEGMLGHKLELDNKLTGTFYLSVISISVTANKHRLALRDESKSQSISSLRITDIALSILLEDAKHTCNGW